MGHYPMPISPRNSAWFHSFTPRQIGRSRAGKSQNRKIGRSEDAQYSRRVAGVLVMQLIYWATVLSYILGKWYQTVNTLFIFIIKYHYNTKTQFDMPPKLFLKIKSKGVLFYLRLYENLIHLLNYCFRY